MKIAISLLLLVLICNGEGGFKTTLTQNGLNYLTSVGMRVLEQQLEGLVIPELKGVVDTPIGKIDWNLSNLALRGFSITQSALQVVPGVGLKAEIVNLNAQMTLNWHYRKVHWPHISDHGSADIGLEGANTVVEVYVSEVNGRPNFRVVGDTVHIDKLHIKLHGGASWLYNIFIDIFSHEIRNAVDGALQKAIPSAIDDGLNKALSTLPVVVRINDHIELNYLFTQNPSFGGNYLSVSSKGEFFETAAPSECPANICPQSSSPDVVTGQMMQFILTDYVPNTILYVLNQMHRLQVTIAANQVPSWFPLKFNTFDWRDVIPPLYQKWPNQTMQVTLECSVPPHATFHPSGPVVFAMGNLQLDIVDSGKIVPAFVLGGNASVSASVKLSGQDLFVQIGYLDALFHIESSQIGIFNTDPLNKYINMLFSQGLVPIANIFLQQPIQLPTVKGVTFNNPSLGWGNDYLYISTDITYNPSQDEMAIPIRID